MKTENKEYTMRDLWNRIFEEQSEGTDFLGSVHILPNEEFFTCLYESDSDYMFLYSCLDGDREMSSIFLTDQALRELYKILKRTYNDI